MGSLARATDAGVRVSPRRSIAPVIPARSTSDSGRCPTRASGPSTDRRGGAGGPGGGFGGACTTSPRRFPPLPQNPPAPPGPATHVSEVVLTPPPAQRRLPRSRPAEEAAPN